MSRVDDALRRALSESGGATAEETASSRLPELDNPEALAAEPFPIEMAERRSVRAQARPAVAPASVSMESFAAPEGSQAPARGRLIERMDGHLAQKVVVDRNTLPLSREQYRRLAGTLHQAQVARDLKVIMIGSAVPGEGKTLTAANLALTFSESYKRSVLLIDADLRRPSQHQVFQVQNSNGLSEGLGAPVETPMKVRQISQRLALLPAGQPTSDPMAGLTSPRMGRLVSEAREMFDWVIIDTPPVGLLPDASLLAALVDGAILVVRAGSTPHAVVRRAVDALGRAKLLGMLLNRAERAAAMSHYDYYESYYGVKAEAAATK